MVKDLSESSDDNEKKVLTDVKIPMDGSPVDILKITGIELPPPKVSGKHTKTGASGHIPLMKLQQISEDEIVLNRVHWELIKNKGSMYIFRRRGEADIQRMRNGGEFSDQP